MNLKSVVLPFLLSSTTICGADTTVSQMEQQDYSIEVDTILAHAQNSYRGLITPGILNCSKQIGSEYVSAQVSTGYLSLDIFDSLPDGTYTVKTFTERGDGYSPANGIPSEVRIGSVYAIGGERRNETIISIDFLKSIYETFTPLEIEYIAQFRRAINTLVEGCEYKS